VAVLLERSGGDLLPQVSQALGPRNKRLAKEAVAAAEAFVDCLAELPAGFENFMRVGEAFERHGSGGGA
jgi:hypothetical protein